MVTEVVLMACAIGQVLVGSRKKLIIGLVDNDSAGLEKPKGDVGNTAANHQKIEPFIAFELARAEMGCQQHACKNLP